MAPTDEKRRYQAKKPADDRGCSLGRKLKSPDAHANKETRETQKAPEIVPELTRLAARDGDFDNILSPPSAFDRNAQSIRILATINESLGVRTTGIGWRAALPTSGIVIRHDR